MAKIATVPKHIEEIARVIATAHGLRPWAEYVRAAWAVARMPPIIPEHKGSATIHHNGHLVNYQSVAQEELNNPEWFVDAWVNEVSRQHALDMDTLWSVQWYPETPVGFQNLCAGRWSDIVVHLLAPEEVS